MSPDGPVIDPDALRKNVSGIDFGSMPASLTCEAKLVICATTRHGAVIGESSLKLSTATAAEPDAATSMAARSASSAAVVAASVSILTRAGRGDHPPGVGGPQIEWVMTLATFIRPIRRRMVNSLSARSALIIERGSCGKGSRVGAEEILGGRRSPLRQPGRGERRPAGFQRAVEHVAVAEVLDQKTIGVAPVVEDLAALDVSADSPGTLVAMVFQVLTADGQRIEVADLIGRMDVAVRRAQGKGDGVVVGERLATIAADEAHRRAAVALAGKVQEVADDHSELMQVPVERLDDTWSSATPHARDAAHPRAAAVVAERRWRATRRRRN